MTSSSTTLYSQPGHNGSSSSLSHSRQVNSMSGLGYKSTQQPSFTASTSTLPGALGISSSSSNPKLSAYALPNSKSQDQLRTSSTSISSLNSEEGSSNPKYRMQTTLSDSLRTSGRGIQLMMDNLDNAESSLQRGANAGTGNINNNGRNILVPIGSTGARQKLSILSASQRPMAAQKSIPQGALPQRPRTSSESNRGQEGEGTIRRRPQTGEQTGKSIYPPPAPSSQSAGKGASPLNLRRPSTGAGETSRTFTNQYVPPEMDAPGSSRQWNQSNGTATPTQERPQPSIFRQTSHDSINSMGVPASRSHNSLSKEAQSPSSKGLKWTSNRRYVSAEQPPSQLPTAQSEYNVWEYQLPPESPKSKQFGRPASSSGRDRAAKLGAGFKSMFSSKSSKEQSPKTAVQNGMTASPSSLSQNSPQSSSHSSTPTKQQQQQRRPSTASPSVVSNQPLQNATGSSMRVPLNHTFVDLSTAQSAGWTTSQDIRQSASTSIPTSASAPAPRLQSRVFINGGSQLKSSDLAPSIDFAIPAGSPLLESFALSQDSTGIPKGLGSTRMAKGPATTGLNLEVAGHSIPLLQHLVDQEVDAVGSNRSIDKSLPPTPDPSLAGLAGEGQQPQQRNHSDASNWSSNTVLGPPALIQPPATMSASQMQTRPNRGASVSSFADSSRRASNATNTSEHNGSETARRPSSSAQSTSGESNYSAPNSSRAWSPAAFEKPTAPITSPLLATILSQQQISAENSLSQLRRIASPLSVTSNGTSTIPAESCISDSQPPGTPISSRSRSSTLAKPDLPARPRERLQGPQPDPATLAKLEQGSAALLSSSSDGGSTVDTNKTPTRPDKTALPAESVNRALYVPPGALTYTRKGTAVRPSVTKSSITSVGDSTNPSDTPRASLSSSAPRMSNTATDLEKGGDGHVITFTSTDFEGYDEEISMDTVNLLPSSAWIEVEIALNRFKTISMQNNTSDKGGLLRSVLLPFLALEAETSNVEVSGAGPFQSGKSRRTLFFEWIQHLLMELQTIQTSADRGAILESIACIIESKTFSASMFQMDKDDEKKFYSVFGHILNYAIGELNKKGVYQNTLIFSGRLLAVAFFRVDNVASKLLRALPVNRFALERVAAEAKWDVNCPAPEDWEAYKQRFPASLTDFCFQDARSYLKMLDSHTSISSNPSMTEEQADDDRFLVRQGEIEVEMSGNWLRRWQSDDSELFFSFCRNYHRQLAALLTSGRGWESMRTLFFGGPGYAHLATCIHQKCLSLVHRDILSVTTLSSQKNFNPGETANVLSGSTAGKPRHLEAANRRCTAIVVDIVRASLSHPLLFGPMLGIHIKSLIKRTSLYDVQGVFCLLDWLDGVLGHMESAELPVERLVDIEFVIETVWLLLRDADHALALMRTIAFCYSNFAVLASTTKNRVRFCEEILLHPKIFQKLFLSWSFTIRAYFLHLLVFRLARINDFAQPEDDVKGKTAVNVARLFNQRLDEIRRRHDELSPSPSSADSGSEEGDELSRLKARPQSFVSTIKHTPLSNKHGSPAAISKAERVLGIGLPDPSLSTKGESKAQSRAAKWLRALGGKGASKGGKRIEGPGTNYGSSPTMDSRFFSGYNESPKRMAKVDELSLSDEDDLDDDNESYPDDDGGESTPKAEGQFEFSFDAQNGHSDGSPVERAATKDQDKAGNDHISSKLSFDLQNPSSSHPPSAEGQADGSTNGKLPLSINHDRISRAFSKRQSILPGPAFNLVNHENESEAEEDAARTGPGAREIGKNGFFTYQKRKDHTQKADPYVENLHIYAVQSLREYEQTVQEHDEFFSKQADAGNPQVPRLPIQWPAMWSE
jgi:hypothetical protein